MLKAMRESLPYILKIVIGAVVVSFIVTIFYGWGVRSAGPAGVGPGVVATVNGEPIRYEQFRDLYEQRVRTLREQFGGKLDDETLQRLNLRGRIVNQLIASRLVVQEARRLGLQVGDEEVRQQVMTYPAFAVQGRFSREQYLRLLQVNGITPARFEQSVREELLTRKLESLIRDGAKVSEREAADAFAARRGRVKVEVARLAATELADKGAKLQEAFSQGQGWTEALQAAGVTPTTTDYFAPEAPPPDLPQQGLSGALAGLRPGDISPLIRGEEAAFVFRLVDRQAPEPGEYEQAKDQWKRAAVAAKAEQLVSEWLAELQRKAKIEIERES
jgi:parvulin-like peptidyl-prolyl isomerase